ncbi:MAG: MCE family protein, partial [Mycobacteriaceae bacterium]
ELVTTAAKNLDGNGEALGETISQLSVAAKALSDSRGDIVDTIKNLNSFVGYLAANDEQVRQFNSQLAQFTGFLADERQTLGEALNQLSYALGDVARFIGDNRDKLDGNIQGLQNITQIVSDERDALAETLMNVPLALSNLTNAYNAESGTLDLHVVLPDLQDPLGVGCKLIDLAKLMPGDPRFEALGRQIQPLIDQCQTITNQITAGIKTPSLILPFGILSGENIQNNVVPGTVPGVPSPRMGGN